MLNALFAFLAAIKNYIEDILAQFPKTATALATAVASLVSYFGYKVSAGDVTAIAVAVVTIFSVLVNHSENAAELRALKAAKPAR
jgi:hypothetical protein